MSSWNEGGRPRAFYLSRWTKVAAASVLALVGFAGVGAVATAEDDPLPTETVYVPIEREYQGQTARWWAARAVKARREANSLERVPCRRQRELTRRSLRSSPHGNHWLDRAFLCIHGGEGAWSSNTGNGFYGGLQMDVSFQRAHGAEFLRAFGTADRWPVSVQMAVGIRAWLTRGFGPWPTTRRLCGL